MSSEDTRKDPTLICSKCKRFEAKRTCDVCHFYICLACSRKTIVRYTNGSTADSKYDYEFMKLTRCVNCLSNLPQLQYVDQRTGCVIS